jgi:vWA-MoxR associated protein C-terminal domain/vWA-MoxR associated protein middle region (VMAP-M) 1/Effector-associated domain 9
VSNLFQFRLKQLEVYKKQLEALENDCEVISSRLSYSDPVECNRLKRKQSDCFKEMEELVILCDKCEEGLAEIAIRTGDNWTERLEALAAVNQLLISLLNPHELEIKNQINNAYQFACPSDWPRREPETLKGKLAELEDMPLDESGYSPLLKFVAYLVVNKLMREEHRSLCRELQQWAEQRSQKFAEVLECVQSSMGSPSSSSQRQTHSYLMVVIERSRTVDQRKEPRYFVKSWLILEGQSYQTGKATGAEVLSTPGASEDAENAFTVDEIQELLKAFLQESREKSRGQGRLLENLTVELFLPSDLLNHEINRWEDTTDEFSLAEPIGYHHRLLIRSSDRLTSNYLLKRAVFWKDKWQQVRQREQDRLPQNAGLNNFVLGDNVSGKDLFYQLNQPQKIGLKLSQVPLSTIGKDSTFAALHSSGTPIAIWMRQSLASVDCAGAIDQLLSCCVHDIPDRVKQQRQEAFREKEPDCHIGHHLALLWEDFDRLPPGYDPYRTSA